MSEYDRVSKEHVEVVFTGGNTLTANVGAIIDTKGYDSLTYNLVAGAISAGAFVIEVEEGDASNLSDATTVPAAELIGPDGATAASMGFSAGQSTGAQSLGDIGKKRYHRLTISAAGGTGPIAGVAVQGGGRKQPTE